MSDEDSGPFFMVDGVEHCIEEDILAELLREEVLFANSRRDMMQGRPEDTTVLLVYCSDTFAYACADCEDLPYGEIGSLYKAWKAHGNHGVTRWCALRRGMRPLPKIEGWMREAGAWDDALESLPPYPGQRTANAKGPNQ